MTKLHITIGIKVRVKAYIKVIDKTAWRSVLTRWTPLTVITNGVSTSKSKEAWSKDESALAIANFKALNVIFATIVANQF